MAGLAWLPVIGAPRPASIDAIAKAARGCSRTVPVSAAAMSSTRPRRRARRRGARRGVAAMTAAARLHELRCRMMRKESRVIVSEWKRAPKPAAGLRRRAYGLTTVSVMPEKAPTEKSEAAASVREIR